jgi:hypothetical protein
LGEFDSSRERLEVLYSLMDGGQGEVVLVEDVETVPHEHVIIRFISGGTAKVIDTGGIGDSDPKFGEEDSLQVKADNIHSAKF